MQLSLIGRISAIQLEEEKKLYRSIVGAGVNLSARPTALVGEQFFYHTSPLDWFCSSPCVFPISKPIKTFVHQGKNCLHKTPQK